VALDIEINYVDWTFVDLKLFPDDLSRLVSWKWKKCLVVWKLFLFVINIH